MLLTTRALALAVLLAVLAGCDRSPPPPGAAPPPPPHDLVTLAGAKPEYHFAAGLAEQYPDVVAFVRQFLETCLVGDYTEYRRLVSRTTDPESRARFEKILNSLRALVIESIEPLALPSVGDAWLVLARIDFLPDRKVALRRGENSRLGILVFREDGEFRMAPAPAELQPERDEPVAASTPVPVRPDYPWQEGADY